MCRGLWWWVRWRLGRSRGLGTLATLVEVGTGGGCEGVVVVDAGVTRSYMACNRNV